jgi:hypothetical protein
MEYNLTFNFGIEDNFTIMMEGKCFLACRRGSTRRHSFLALPPLLQGLLVKDRQSHALLKRDQTWKANAVAFRPSFSVSRLAPNNTCLLFPPPTPPFFPSFIFFQFDFLRILLRLPLPNPSPLFHS